MIQSIPADWQELLNSEFEKPYFKKLEALVLSAYQNSTVFPETRNIFNALNLCPFECVKVVIIGQDPYHAAGQAHGLCFSVNPGVKPPPSLKNIFKELKSDLGDSFTEPKSGNLESWARQGVLMLNAILSVQEGLPGSHKNFGWEEFTNTLIRLVSEKKDHVVFMLWGNYAFGKESLIDQSKHMVLKAAHPSPLARGAFFGCRHFSKANMFLEEKGLERIDWSLTSSEGTI